MKGISNFKGLKVMFGAFKKKKRKWFHLLVFIYNKRGKKEIILINVFLILGLGIK